MEMEMERSQGAVLRLLASGRVHSTRAIAIAIAIAIALELILIHPYYFIWLLSFPSLPFPSFSPPSLPVVGQLVSSLEGFHHFAILHSFSYWKEVDYLDILHWLLLSTVLTIIIDVTIGIPNLLVEVSYPGSASVGQIIPTNHRPTYK
jgi:hypothetical protein